MNSLISKYPDFYINSPEFVDIQAALEPEILELWNAKNSILAQLDVETATWGLKFWEQTIGIAVDESKDLNHRRSTIKAKLRGAGTTTLEMVKSIAESFSNGKVELIEHSAISKVELHFISRLGIPPNMEDLTTTLREVFPAHLTWEYIYIYHTHKQLSRFTYAELSFYTHKQLQEDEDLSQPYNSHAMIEKLTHADLNVFTHAQLREDVFE